MKWVREAWISVSRQGIANCWKHTTLLAVHGPANLPVQDPGAPPPPQPDAPVDDHTEDARAALAEIIIDLNDADPLAASDIIDLQEEQVVSGILTDAELVASNSANDEHDEQGVPDAPDVSEEEAPQIPLSEELSLSDQLRFVSATVELLPGTLEERAGNPATLPTHPAVPQVSPGLHHVLLPNCTPLRKFCEGCAMCILREMCIMH